MLDSRLYQMPGMELPPFAGSIWSQTQNFLSKDECQSIIHWGEEQALDWAGVVGYDDETKQLENRVEGEHRLVQATGLPEEGYEWLYTRLAEEALKINNDFWRFDIRGCYEDISFLKYTHFEGRGPGRFNWHSDVSGDSIRHRKVSMIIQLSDPTHYDGCNLEFFTGENVRCDTNQQGSLITFPSNSIHRITPIARGTRYSLVMWVTGPPFR